MSEQKLRTGPQKIVISTNRTSQPVPKAVPEVEAPVEATEAQQSPNPTPASAPEQDERIEALIRREKQLRKQAEDLAKQKAEVEAAQAGRLTADEWRERFMEDPSQLGIGYEEMADRYLRQPTPEEQTIMELRRELEELKGGQSSIKQELENARSASYEQAKKQISSEVGRLVQTSEDYPLIAAAGAEDRVTAYIEQVYQDEGVLISTDEAAREVEDYLLEQAATLAKIEKVRAKIEPAPTAQQPEASQETQPTAQTPPKTTTLTHSMVQQSSRPLTRLERAKLIAAGRGHELPDYKKG